MKAIYTYVVLGGLIAGMVLVGCQRTPVSTPTASLPAPTPTSPLLPTPAATTAVITPTTVPIPSTTPSATLPKPTPTTEGLYTYAVVGVEPDEGLSVHSGPGVNYDVVGTLPYDATQIHLTGQRAQAQNITWEEIEWLSESPLRGWVNGRFLTQYVPPEAFCNAETASLIEQFEQAIRQADGRLLATLVSPVHGVDIWLWRSGRVINFDPAHARWVFNSTYVHNWGANPASGLDTRGSFQEAVLPVLRDAIQNPHEIRCNDRTVGGVAEEYAWPARYRNINVYKIFKPGTPGIDLDWRIWLVGVEYVENNPYLFALIHFQWEP
ncbi:hypothetical protein QYE77_06020 [Thermanaerothrix sp. 4228-RoL]|uniref:SH3b domain-containing protein n=1 Tax=Thermanaerothrix solaris TaxID=3058434 RepID=A0ABU3NLU4_9CHLR|nr:hypothetical protein [Thermanaerothrix sp. 4228-RoL]MDT8897818.1 hypothetical protein [Thermanaerothrix sp. 4228-RoL]